MNKRQIIAKNNSLIDNHYNSCVLIEVERDGVLFTSTSQAIAPGFIITTAHSVEGIDKGRVSVRNPKTNEITFNEFKEIYIHPSYNKRKSNFEHDIAIIELVEPLEDVDSYPVLNKTDNLSDEIVTRIGFGGRNGLNNRVWTNPVIKSHKNHVLELEDDFSVTGDSGGPIIWGNTLIGIHSTLEGSNKTYAVNLAFYHNWIGGLINPPYSDKSYQSQSLR